MTDKQIVKALECCKREECDRCPFSNKGLGVCGQFLIEQAFDLVRRQQEEIEWLKSERDNTQRDILEAEERARYIDELVQEKMMEEEE